jgi:copper transport protein
VKRAAFAGLLLALAAPAQAFAHASIQHAWPASHTRVDTSPRFVRVQFDQIVTALPGSIQVLTAGGRDVAGPARASGRNLVARVPRLPKGPYTVRWKATSDDGHIVSGVYTFGVRYPAPPVTEAVGAEGPTRTEHVVRWAYFLALAVLLGGIGFRLLVARGPLPVAAERRFFRLTGLGVVAVLEVGIIAFLLRAEDALQLPFGRFLYGDLSPLADGTRFGQAFIAMTLGYALVAAFLFFAWLTERRALLWPAFLLGLGFASGLSLSGHATESGAAAELADWVHLGAAALWLGGLLQLVVVVWPAARAQRRELFLRFSRLATALVALLVGAGIYLSLLRLPRAADLWESGYGRVLLVKLTLVCVALLWGALHHFVARPLLEHGGPAEGLLARLQRSLLGESAVGMAVLLAAAVLVDSAPPPKPAPTPPVASNVSR